MDRRGHRVGRRRVSAGHDEVIYLDHPATSWPKPPVVIRAMREFLETAGGNPGRSGHSLSVAAGRAVHQTRDALARFFGVASSDHLAFAHNATHALNMVIQTVLRPGDTALTTAAEHNSVMRPLREMEARGVRLLIAPCDAAGEVDLDAFRKLAQENVRLAVVAHASNVIGRIAPVAELCAIAKGAGAMILLDAAQTAGALPVAADEIGADFIAFTGHKALQGPAGTGGLALCTDRAAKEIRPFVRGGTGSGSESEVHPDVLPDRLEAGTPNGVGIAGLGAAVNWIAEYGLERIRAHHADLMQRLVGGLAQITGVEVFGPPADVERAPLVSFRIAGKSVSEVGLKLDEQYGILCRVGLHCAPAAHRTIGTFPQGAVRFGIGPLTSEEEVESAVSAVAEIAADG